MKRIGLLGGMSWQCTEIDLLVGPDDSPVPLFDTTRLHAERAVELAVVAEVSGVRPDG